MKFTPTPLLAAALLLTAAAGSIHAQTLISWGLPQTITGDADLAQEGTYFDAVNINPSFTGTNVDGTFFNTMVYSDSNDGSDGSISVNSPAFSYAGTGFSGGSTAYNYMVNEATYSGSANVIIGSETNPLSIGDTYHVQVWDYWNNGPYEAYVSGSPAVTFDYPAFQYAVGTFTATAPTESFYWTGAPDANGAGFLNDVSVYNLGAVPEPSTWAAMLSGFGLLAFWRMRGRRA